MSLDRPALRAALQFPKARTAFYRIGWGFLLPLRILGAVLKHPTARRLYVRVIAVQLAVSVAVGTFFTYSSRDSIDDHGNINIRKDIGSEPTIGPQNAVGKSPDNENFELHINARSISVTDKEKTSAPSKTSPWAFWSALYGTLSAIEWIVVALSRDFHDSISRQASLVLGLSPEDSEQKPRVRLNTKWLFKKLKNRIRGFKVIITAVPLLALFALIPAIGHYVYVGLNSLWTYYWLCVFVAAKSARAWTREKDPQLPLPWYLRGYDHTMQMRIFQWGPFRWYRKLWHRFTKDMFSPAHSFEQAPFEIAGIAIVRLLGTIPGFYLIFRPILPVASAFILNWKSSEQVAQNYSGIGAGSDMFPGATPAPTACVPDSLNKLSNCVANTSVNS